MDARKHVRASNQDCESVYDAARKNWADRVGEMHVRCGDRQRIAFEEAGPSSARERRNIAQALKSSKQTTRMGEKVKAFLVQTFNQRVAGVQKAESIQLAREMKSIRDSRGKLQFKPLQTNEQPLNKLVTFSQGCQRYRATDKLMKWRARRRNKK